MDISGLSKSSGIYNNNSLSIRYKINRDKYNLTSISLKKYQSTLTKLHLLLVCRKITDQSQKIDNKQELHLCFSVSCCRRCSYSNHNPNNRVSNHRFTGIRISRVKPELLMTSVTRFSIEQTEKKKKILKNSEIEIFFLCYYFCTTLLYNKFIS